MRKTTLAIVSLLVLGLAVLAGCGGTKKSSSTSSGEGGATADAAACTPAKMETHSAGTLTIATDDPGYPPYFEENEPENGKGFESAVGYAIGKQLGYPKSKVKWTREQFDSSYAPGPKSFDFDLNEITITPTREKAVDFSVPYYSAEQAVVAVEGTKAASAKSLAELKEVKFGVQINTTSLSALEEEIEPSNKPEVFNGATDVISALKNGQIEAAVVDLPTALEVIETEVENATVVGQFGKAEGEPWGALLAKESPLTSCVSGAVEALKESGELEKITQRWMSRAANAPELH
jgi:polar amino acid transport system substrate-binding protein